MPTESRTSSTPTTAPHPHERLAQRRAKAKLGWYMHASIYVLVNVFLALVSARSSDASGHSWAIYPALGWGFGLFMHGVGVWVSMPGGTLYQQLLERERAHLRQHPPQ